MPKVNNVVILVSTPRSGSSWLARLLTEHPQLHVYTHNKLDTHVLYMMYPLKSLNPLGDDYINPDTTWDHFLRPLRKLLLTSLYRMPVSGQTLTISTPTVAAFLPLLNHCFPEAKFVHLQRNPLDRIASFRKFMENRAGDFLQEEQYRSRGRLFVWNRSFSSQFSCLAMVTPKASRLHWYEAAWLSKGNKSPAFAIFVLVLRAV